MTNDDATKTAIGAEANTLSHDPGTAQDHELDSWAARLEVSGRFRILRQLEPLSVLGDTQLAAAQGGGLHCAIVLDTETTGLLACASSNGQTPSEVISLAMVAVAYGTIVGQLGCFHRLRQPLFPIPPEATKIHGIDDARVAGCSIGAAEIRRWIADMTARVSSAGDTREAPLCIAHNAAFDRKMVERHWPNVFSPLPWACSQSQIPWSALGYEGTKLQYLGVKAGFFYQQHDALADCHAVVDLLHQRSNATTTMAALLATCMRTDVRLFAIGAAYETRGDLKARGYRWSNGEDQRPRAWFIDRSKGDVDLEIAYLHDRILGPSAQPLQKTVTPIDRFSIRD